MRHSVDELELKQKVTGALGDAWVVLSLDPEPLNALARGVDSSKMRDLTGVVYSLFNPASLGPLHVLLLKRSTLPKGALVEWLQRAGLFTGPAEVIEVGLDKHNTIVLGERSQERVAAGMVCAFDMWTRLPAVTFRSAVYMARLCLDEWLEWAGGFVAV